MPEPHTAVVCEGGAQQPSMMRRTHPFSNTVWLGSKAVAERRALSLSPWFAEFWLSLGHDVFFLDNINRLLTLKNGHNSIGLFLLLVLGDSMQSILL